MAHGWRRRLKWNLAGLTAVVMLGAMVYATSAGAQTGATPLQIPPSGSLFGAFAAPLGDGQTQTTVATLASQSGRSFDVNRVYALWDTAEPTSMTRYDVANGIVPLLSISAVTTAGTAIPWARIAAGSDDAAIISQARALTSLNAPVLLSFSHEPENNPANGTAANFVAAWRHYVSVFRAQGASNVSFALILESRTYDHATAIVQYYPGDNYVDWMGTDGYNPYGCKASKGWTDFSTVFKAFNAFAVAHSKPAVIAEWASSEDPATPGRKGQWIAQAAQTLEGWPQVKASIYFDAPGTVPACGWALTTSTSAMDAYRAMGASTYFNPRPRAALLAAPTSGPAPLAISFDTTGTRGILHPIATWSLNFGDGSLPASGPSGPPSSLAHSYAAGMYTAAMTVTDSVGQSSFNSVVVTAYSAPTVTEGSGWSTSVSSATLAGTVIPGGLDTSYHFDWGTTSYLGQSSAAIDIGTGTRAVHLSINLSGLLPGSDYYWNLAATNGATTSTGVTQTFTTPGGAPGISGSHAALVSPTSATLSAQVNPHQLATTWQFELGTSTAYGTGSPQTPGNAGTGSLPVAVTASITGLRTGVTYHFAIVATNQLGTTVSPDHTLKT